MKTHLAFIITLFASSLGFAKEMSVAIRDGRSTEIQTIDIPEKDVISLSDIAKLLQKKFIIGKDDILNISINGDLKISINVGAALKDQKFTVSTDKLHVVIKYR